MKNVISITDGVARHPLYRMAEPINFNLTEGEQLAIVGDNASGKSILVDTILGRYPLLQNEVEYYFPEGTSHLVSDNIKYISFRDSYGDADASTYYQQRWNAMDQDGFALVKELLRECKDINLQQSLYKLFDIEELLEKPIIQLSSGEMRKFQLVRVLLTRPSILILDNPFIGLDFQTRGMLQDLLARLSENLHMQVILVLARWDEIPSFVTHVLPVVNRICGTKVKREVYLNKVQPIPTSVLSEENKMRILNLENRENPFAGEEVVRLNHVTIQYGERTILKGLDWTVHQSDCWALTGSNGSGKSTLLSLVCADNPQSYACDISLFGRKRGTGESIWEIKKYIGYVSPEMHRSYLKSLPAIDIVASGLHDSIGLYQNVHDEDRVICRWWMSILGIEQLADRTYLQLSSGEQRMVLLARAFVKDPSLLVLDEPMHGLDLYHRQLVKDVIETFCKRKGKTLIMVTHYQEDLPGNITHTLTLKKN